MILRYRAHRGCIAAVPKLKAHHAVLVNSLCELYGKCQEGDDEVVWMHTIFLLIADRHGVEEARRLFARLGTPKFGIDSRRNIIAALYEGSGESKSEFSRKFAAATGAPGAAGVRRYLDRALREIARQERKARLGHSAKKES